MKTTHPAHSLLDLIRVYNLERRSHLARRAKRMAEQGLLSDVTARFYLRKIQDQAKQMERTPNLLPRPASAEELGVFGLELGELHENPCVRIGIRRDARSRHIMVSGTTGAGKSNLLRALILGIDHDNKRRAGAHAASGA